MNETAPSGPVVVGVDGSERSKRALAWAAQYARLTGARLIAMVAWQLPANLGWPLPLPENWTPEADARVMLEQNVKEVLGYDADAGLTMSVVEGKPAPVLTEASKAASLVVVGSRGRGEFGGMLLGSVSEFLVTHAHCPVVVVRDGAGG